MKAQGVFQGHSAPVQGFRLPFVPFHALKSPAERLKFSFNFMGIFGRSERIRTSDPLLPKQVRYQAALHSDLAGGIVRAWLFCKRVIQVAG